MSDYLKRIFAQLVAGLLAHASRLVRLAALRQLLDESTAVLEEAAHLEAKGQPQLARYLRAELNDTLSDVLAADAVPEPSLNGGGQSRPFRLAPPRPPRTSRQGRGVLSPVVAASPGKNGAKPADENRRSSSRRPRSPTRPMSTRHHL